MSYTRLADPQTAWARHLDRIRRERDWSATQLFEHVYEPLHLGPKSRTSFRRVLIDKPPKDQWVPALVELFGAPPAEAPQPVVLEQDPSVAAAIREQTAVMQAQVEATKANTAMLAAVLAQLTGQPPVDPRAAAAIQAQADAASRTSPLPQHDPTGTTGR